MLGFAMATCISLLLIAAVVLFHPTRPPGLMLTGGVGLGLGIGGMLSHHYQYPFGVQNIPMSFVGLSIALAVGALAEPPVIDSSFETWSLLMATLVFAVLWIVRFGKKNARTPR
jgi:hypothetical protein